MNKIKIVFSIILHIGFWKHVTYFLYNNENYIKKIYYCWDGGGDSDGK